eukprot:11108051-Alexandrium_andersonii.AAC.1
MSASLVGSEMCIRDRPRGCARARSAPLSAQTPRIFQRKRANNGSYQNICLLYTSDAADDM